MPLALCIQVCFRTLRGCVLVCQALIGPLTAVADGFKYLEEGSVSAADFDTTLRSSRGTLLRCQTTYIAQVSKLGDPISVMSLLVGQTVPNHLNRKKFDLPLEPWTNELCALGTRAAVICKVLAAILAMVSLACEPSTMSYEAAAQQWLQWRSQNSPPIGQPYLLKIMDFCKLREEIHVTAGTFPAFTHSSTTADFAAILTKDAGTLMAFVTQSAFSSHVVRQHCEAKVLDGVDYWVGSILTSKLTLVSPSIIQDRPLHQVMPMLLSCDFDSVAKFAHTHLNCKVLNSIVTKDLPHCEVLRVVDTIVSRVGCMSLVIPSLQDATAELGFNKDMLSALLHVHGELHTVLLLSVCAHTALLVINSGKASMVHVEVFRGLVVAMDELDVSLKAEALQILETEPYKLTVAIASIRGWLAVLKDFVELSVGGLVAAMCSNISVAAGALEQKLPNWKAFITDSSLNEALVQQKLLKHEHKGAWNKDATALHQMIVDTVAACTVLRFRPGFERDEVCTGSRALAESAIEDAYRCLAVQAASNAVFNFAKHPNGSCMAEQTLIIVDGMKDFRLPTALHSRVKALADSSPLEAPPAKKQRLASPTAAAVSGSGASSSTSGMELSGASAVASSNARRASNGRPTALRTASLVKTEPAE